MARPLYLHIGTMKSGTTQLQSMLDVNKAALAEAGIYWAGSGRNFGATSAHREDRKHSWPKLAAEIRDHPGQAILSNELLSTRRQHRIEPLIPELEKDVRIVITARDLGRVIPSQWHTGARNAQEQVAWPDFIEALTKDRRRDPYVQWFWRRQDLPRIIDIWRDVLPGKPITLVTVPPAGSPSELILQRFMSLLGVDSATLDPPLWRDPPDYLETSEFMRLLTARLEDLPQARFRAAVKFVISQAARKEPHAFTPTKIMLTSAQMKWARKRATEMVEDVDKRGVEVVGDLNDLIPPPDAPTGPSVSQPKDADVLEVALKALEAVAREWPVSEADRHSSRTERIQENT